MCKLALCYFTISICWKTTFIVVILSLKSKFCHYFAMQRKYIDENKVSLSVLWYRHLNNGDGDDEKHKKIVFLLRHTSDHQKTSHTHTAVGCSCVAIDDKKGKCCVPTRRNTITTKRQWWSCIRQSLLMVHSRRRHGTMFCQPTLTAVNSSSTHSINARSNEVDVDVWEGMVFVSNLIFIKKIPTVQPHNFYQFE